MNAPGRAANINTFTKNIIMKPVKWPKWMEKLNSNLVCCCIPRASIIKRKARSKSIAPD